MNFIVNFTHYLEKLGFIPNPDNIHADGKFHRIKHTNDKQGRASGSYILFADSCPAAHIHNFKLGQSFTWKYRGCKLDKLVSPQNYTKIRDQRLAKQFHEYRRNAWKAFQRFQDFLLKPSEPTYLTRKHVLGYGVRFDQDNNMYIPYRDNNGYIQTVQTITSQGQKRFATGCKKVGSYHKIGFYAVDKYKENYTEYILIGEGYATMASVYMASYYPVVIAGDAGNLSHVVFNLSIKYPNAKLVICADNDITGLSKAQICQVKFDCKVITPIFSQEFHLIDFNDLHLLNGINAVKTQIIEQLRYATRDINKINGQIL